MMWNIEELTKGTQLVVEANSYERMTLWQAWKDKAEWVHVPGGKGVDIGKLDKRSVFISLCWAVIQGVVMLP